MRLLLIDDHRVMLAGLAALLRMQDWVDDVDTAATGEEAVARAAAHHPDVAVLDLDLAGVSGLSLIGPITAAAPGCRILILTMSLDPRVASEALSAGAAGVTLKDDGPDEVLAAVRLVAVGGTALSRRASAGIVRSGRLPSTTFTERDRELLKLLAQGLTTEAIGHALYLSPKTVRNRLSELYRRLGVSGRTAAVAIAVENGL